MLNILQIMLVLPRILAAAEAIHPQSGGGAQKLAFVLNALTVMVPKEQMPTFMQKVWPAVQIAVTELVALYNATQFFRKGGGEPLPEIQIATPNGVIDPGGSLVTAAMSVIPAR